MSSRDQGVLMQVRDLRVRYDPSEPDTLGGVSFSIDRGETVALVGDSGCGKTTMALAIMQLLPPGAIGSGSIQLCGDDKPVELMGMNASQMQQIRGERVAMVFQHPQRSLNPVKRVGSQIEEVLRLHTHAHRSDARMQAVQLLSRVGIPDPERLARAWPHELSGGMAQRIGLAIALAGQPDLLIADEPTSALDLSVQAQVVELFRELRRETGMALLLITHDWSVAFALADRVCVMDGNRIVEDRRVGELNSSQVHPAARRLIDAANRRKKFASTEGGGSR